MVVVRGRGAVCVEEYHCLGCFVREEAVVAWDVEGGKVGVGVERRGIGLGEGEGVLAGVGAAGLVWFGWRWGWGMGGLG